jgi:hypothetical protein
MSWPALVAAVAFGNAATPIVEFVLRAIGLVVLLAIIFVLWG